MDDRPEIMRNREYRILPIILTSMLLLIQSGPTSMLNNTPVTLMSEDSNECLTFQNVSHDYDYSQPSQDAFNISADMVNNCSDAIMYPSTLIENDTIGIETSSDDTNWRYIIGDNSSYHVVWEVTRNSTVSEGAFVTFELHPTRDNCFENCSESQNYSYNLTVPFGLVDVNACYAIENITDDYSPSQSSFILSADLNNTCWGGDIHYPAGILLEGAGYSSSPAEGSESIGQMAYLIWENTSTSVNWQITLDQNLANGTSVNFSLQPSCAVYSSSFQITPSYMQDCSLSTFDIVSHTVMNGTPSNQTHWPERIFIWPDDVGGYDTAQNYNLSYNNSDDLSVHTLYELDNLVNNVTYLIEWYISNGTTNSLSLVASGNFTTNSSSNTGHSAPVPNASLNLSEDCYGVWAELYDDSGQLLDFDEFLLCIDDVSNATTTDSDGDSIPDSDDDCPNTPAGTAVDSHGCPEDSDGDSIPDSDDDCPNTPAGTAVDSHGCPEQIPVESQDCANTSTGGIHRDTAVIFFISWTDSSGNAHCGTLHIDLHDGAAPIHSENFRQHVQYGNYNGSIFHRIINGFMIQGGDFETGLGYGGYAASWQGYCNGQAIASESDCSSTNLYTIPDEANNGFNHVPGVISMAKTNQPNTGGSQFFFVDQNSSTSHLDGVHTVFGVALGGSIDGVNSTGLAVIDAISQVATGSSDKPVYDVTITKAILYDSPSEQNDDDEGQSEDDESQSEGEDVSESGFVPGFGITLGFCALIGAALYRRK